MIPSGKQGFGQTSRKHVPYTPLLCSKTGVTVTGVYSQTFIKAPHLGVS